MAMIKRIWRNVVWHDCFGKAAELAFYFQLALFPFLIFLLSTLSYVPEAKQIILYWLERLMPPDAMTIVRQWVGNVFERRSGGWLSFSLIFSLWSASYGVKALIGALNNAHEVEEGRPWWKAQLLAVILTVALCLLVIGGVVVIVFGDPLVKTAGEWLGVDSGLGTFLRNLIGFFMLLSGAAVVYYFAPNARQKWRWIAPGSLFTVIAFILVSYLFSFYMRYAPGYHDVYGNLAAVIVLMLWLYLMAFIFYVGGEINSELQKKTGKPAVPKENRRRH